MDFVVLRDEWSLATILRRLNNFERSLDIISFSGYYQHSKVARKKGIYLPIFSTSA